MGPSWSEVRCSARVDLLMSEPPFGQQEPAVSEVTLVTQNSGVAIHPVIVEWSERKIWIVYKLLIGDPSRVTTIKTTGVEIECQQLVLVWSPAYIQICLPQIVLAVVTLPVCSHVSAVQTKFQRPHGFLNYIIGGI